MVLNYQYGNGHARTLRLNLRPGAWNAVVGTRALESVALVLSDRTARQCVLGMGFLSHIPVGSEISVNGLGRIWFPEPFVCQARDIPDPFRFMSLYGVERKYIRYAHARYEPRSYSVLGYKDFLADTESVVGGWQLYWFQTKKGIWPELKELVREILDLPPSLDMDYWSLNVLEYTRAQQDALGLLVDFLAGWEHSYWGMPIYTLKDVSGIIVVEYLNFWHTHQTFNKFVSLVKRYLANVTWIYSLKEV